MGFDPFKGAEEFRAAKRKRGGFEDEEAVGAGAPGAAAAAARRGRGVAFGAGVLDEDDSYGIMDDYVDGPGGRKGMAFEIMDVEDDDEEMLGVR